MFALLLGLGCGEKAANNDSAEAELSCADLDEEQCSSAGCETVYGWPIDQQGETYCRDESIYLEERTYAGCATYQSALTVEVTAGPADGSECWLFSSGGIPDGWLECEELGLVFGVCEE